MSTVTCKQDYSVSVATAVEVDLYWDFELGSLVDRVHGVTFATTSFAAEFQLLQAASGLFATKGIQFAKFPAGGVEIVRYRVNGNTNLLYAGNGMSWTGWFKINDPGTWPSNTMTFMFLSDGALDNFAFRVCSVFGGPPPTLEFFGFTNVGGAFDLSQALPVGVWTFFHLFVDNTTNQIGLSLNLGPPILSGGGHPITVGPTGSIRLDGDGSASGVNMIDVQFAELGFKLSRMFNASELTFLYNGGSGRTWPL